MKSKHSALKKLIILAIVVIFTFVAIHSIWFFGYKIVYKNAADKMEQQYDDLTQTYEYSKTIDGYVCKLKMPSYLGTGGFLTVGDKDAHMVVFDEAGNVVEEDELSVTLHIWPKFFGKVKYGISFRTNSTLTQVYVDSNGNYIRSENNEENLEKNEALIQQYKSEIKKMFEIAKQVWGDT